MLAYYQLNAWEQMSAKFLDLYFIILIQEMHLKMSSPKMAAFSPGGGGGGAVHGLAKKLIM